MIEVPPGLRVPTEVTATGPLSRLLEDQASDSLDDGLDVKIEMVAVYDQAAGRYRVAQLRLLAPDEGEVTGTLLRKIPVQSILRWVIPRAIKDFVAQDSAEVRAYRFPERSAAPSRKPGRRGPSEEDLQAVATIYRLAEIASDAPSRAVAEAFGLEKRTAINWIAKARSRMQVDDGSAADAD